MSSEQINNTTNISSNFTMLNDTQSDHGLGELD